MHHCDFMKPLTGPMVQALIAEIRGCGVHFEVFDKNQYEFTSLNGNDRKKLLQLLPSKLPTTRIW